MGEGVKTKGDAKAEPADIVASEQQKKEKKNKARDARKKAAAEEKKKEKEEELKKQRTYQLQQVNSIRNKDHHNRQLPRPHHVTPAPPPSVKANVPTAPVACAKMGPISGAAASKKSDKAAATRFLVKPVEAFPVLKMGTISSVDASENIESNQPAPVTSVSSSTGSEERSFFVGRILFRISSSANQTKTDDQQTNDSVRLEFGKDIDQVSIMCSQINKDNNNAAAATDVPLEFGMDTDQVSIMCSQINKDNNNAAAATDVPLEFGMDTDQVSIMCSQINKDNNNAAAATDVPLEFGKDTDQVSIMCSQINKDNNNAAAATDVPGTTTATNQLADELDMKETQVVSDAKTTMNPAKNSDDDDDKFEVVRGKGLIRAEQIALNAEATERTQNQAERKKTQAIRKEGQNKFSVLLKESEIEKEQDMEARRAEESRRAEEARREEEAATAAKKKREKRDRKKKRKVVAVETTIEEKSHESGSDAQSWSSVGVLSLAFVCFVSLTAFYMS